jgi:hypothetical protein
MPHVYVYVRDFLKWEIHERVGTRHRLDLTKKKMKKKKNKKKKKWKS